VRMISRRTGSLEFNGYSQMFIVKVLDVSRLNGVLFASSEGLPCTDLSALVGPGGVTVVMGITVSNLF
jgi:hypothetical protein